MRWVRFLCRVFQDERATTTVEWLLVSAATAMLCGTTAVLVQKLIHFLFTRSAVLLATPMG